MPTADADAIGRGTLIVVSTSARTLTQAAHRAGLAVRAVDAFGDVDTMARAQRWQRVALGPAGGLDAGAVLRALDDHGPAPARVVLGSGLEASLDAIDQLAARHVLVGNHPNVWRVAHDPGLWSALARSLGLPTPAIRHADPTDPEAWLLKRAGSSGGQHVQAVTSRARADARASGAWYYQRRIAGEVHSLLFLANARDIRTVGFNRMLPAPPEAATPWVWAGAVRPAGLPMALCARVEAAALALTTALGLRGLNGLDFIVQGDTWFLLELNPRPTATLDLWDVEPMPPLFDLHLRACAGELPDLRQHQPLHQWPHQSSQAQQAGPALSPLRALPSPPGARAMVVAYAGQPLHVPFDAVWPAACRDRPRAGLRLQPGEPLCTLHATHSTAQGVVGKVDRLRQQLLLDLGGAAARTAKVVAAAASSATATSTASVKPPAARPLTLPATTPGGSAAAPTSTAGPAWRHGLQTKAQAS
ncbi:MAG: ATP-grasp domain-containing protein [Betaproteobacteria bacterium]|nr:ATP-grasp domain-containing protein [Betaproteobacteria bacterium]MDE2123463.1 ATP-grasp domain-containing protein [Betaproteobacteria bacterium]MDE2185446.1 ATP-grasp domain-containing protein [Betaproteobacteria bacterium]MDE2323236.1 ATP-grasp domain-containing protein [Betaproteobacteria bacterium]